MRFDIPSKLSFAFLLGVCALTLQWQINLILLNFLFIAAGIFSILSPQKIQIQRLLLKFLMYSLPFLTLVVLLNGLFLREGRMIDTPVGLKLYKGGLLFGLKTGMRLALLSFSILFFFIGTPIVEFIRYLQKVGLPSSLVLVLLLTLHFLRQLPMRINQIFIAQESRGAPVRGRLLSRAKAFLSILIPLVFSSIVETIDRGIALEVRGFKGKLYNVAAETRVAASSLIISFLLLFLAFALIVWRIVQ